MENLEADGTKGKKKKKNLQSNTLRVLAPLTPAPTPPFVISVPAHSTVYSWPGHPVQ